MFKRKADGSHGFVSVFLAIVMVPCITITCLFADLSRVQLSAALAQSSADLALNNTLVNYDQELEQYYGLIASCQDMTEYYETTSEFFTAMLKAQGLSDEETALFDSYLQNLILEYQEVDAVSFLSTDIVDEVTVEAVGDGLGDSAALLEDQIVEFMKYRGPIEITLGIVERLDNADAEEAIKTAEVNEALQAAKETYATVQGELLSQMYNTYKAIKTYDDTQTNNSSPTFSEYSELQSNLSAIWTDYESITELIVQYYANSSGLTQFTAPSIVLSTTAETAVSVGIEKEIEIEATDTEEAYTETIYCVDTSAVATRIQEITDNIALIEEKAAAAYSSYSTITSPNSDSNVNTVQYCLQMAALEESNGYLLAIDSAAQELYSDYAFIAASLSCEEDPDNPTDGTWATNIATAMASAEAVVQTYLSGSSGTSYGALMNAYESISATAVSYVNGYGYTFGSTYLSTDVTVGAFVSAASGYLATLKTYYEARIAELDIAIDGDGTDDGVPSLDTLIETANSFQEARNDWGDTAQSTITDANSQGVSPDYGESELELYEASGENPDESEAAAKEVTEESVAELKTRLTNIRMNLQSAVDAIDAFTYGGTKICEIDTVSEAITAAKTQITESSITLYISENDSYAMTVASALLSPAQSNIYTAPSETDTANPDLDVATPALYEYMQMQFGTELSGLEASLAANEALTEEGGTYDTAAGDAEDESKTIDTSKLGTTNIIDDYTTSKCTAFTALSGAIGIVTDIASLDFDEIRNSIYLTEYVMDMFSYYSYEEEGKYELLEGKHNSETVNITLQDDMYKEAYESVDTLWETEEATEIASNKTLTNIMINTTNNAAYAAEVEYVLYGGQGVSNEDVVKQAFIDIYAIRLAANTLSGFMTFFTGTSNTSTALDGIASTVVFLTSGIVPAALTKSVLILVLAAMESANDLNRLKNGIPVSLIKLEEDDWYYSITDSTGGVASFSGSDLYPLVQPVDENGIFYSDYLYLFLVLNFENESMADDMLLRIGEIIETNMRKKEGSGSTYDLASAYQYFKLSAKLKVDPLMIDLPIIEQTDAWTSFKADDSWCTYEISVIRGYS